MSYSLVMVFPIMLLLVTCIISAIPSSIILVKAAGDYPSYEDCAPCTCANSTIQYPFGICGLLYADCDEANQTILGARSIIEDWRVVGHITKSSYSTRTLRITPTAINPTIAEHSLMEEDASREYDWLLKGGFFNLSHADMVGSIVNCTQQSVGIPGNGTLRNNVKWLDCTESNRYCFFYPQAGFQIPSCDNYNVIVPRNKSYNISNDKDFEQLQQRGFQITWSIQDDDCHSCEASGGRCYSRFTDSYSYSSKYYRFNYDTYCICPYDDVHSYACNDGDVIQHGKSLSAKDMAAIFFALCAVFSIVVVSCIMVRRQSCCCQRSSSEQQQSIRAFMEPVDSRPPSVENFLNYYSSQAPARYSYSQIMTYTNNLEQKVGKGGFGTVYKGKLPNGLLIAVKILDESKQNEQQFIAEVATVGTTCHINLVRLLGYCSHGSKRALVYEYMVNGSLDRHIHGDHKDELDWKQLFSIAVGTARGIAYLHEDCRNRILHCDIKPHNVLLDVNFLPKVADFGLAKISDRGESHISVANRGTLGYAAPEMWSRMYGVVTDKSDVYSYGVLVMEMVGGRKNIDFDHLESRSSQFFYAEWAFKQVEKGEFGNLRKGIFLTLPLLHSHCLLTHLCRDLLLTNLLPLMFRRFKWKIPPVVRIQDIAYQKIIPEDLEKFSIDSIQQDVLCIGSWFISFNQFQECVYKEIVLVLFYCFSIF